VLLLTVWKFVGFRGEGNVLVFAVVVDDVILDFT
jgi:hypothetical protein